MEWSDRTTYQGYRVNQGTAAILAALNKMVRTKTFGGEKEDVSMMQGSYNGGGVAASAGTHDGGGAFDLSAFNATKRVRALRLLGVAAWHRLPSEGPWGAHIHGIVDGDGSASAGAKRQVDAYHNRRNGLANNAPDRGFPMMVFPLFCLPTRDFTKPGYMWAKEDLTAYEQPTTKAPVLKTYPKGTRFSVVAVVRVDTAYWAVTAAGRCIPMSKLARKKPATEDPVEVPTNKKIKLDAAHFSSRFSLTDKQHLEDFDRVLSRGYHFITGTEAGPGAGNTREALKIAAAKYGYRVSSSPRFDGWLAVREDLIKPGSWSKEEIFVFDGSAKIPGDQAGKWGPKGLVGASFILNKYEVPVAIAAAHFLTLGGAGPELKKESDKAHNLAIRDWSASHQEGFAFVGVDFNLNDKVRDVFGGIAPFLTAADEVKNWPGSGHGPIDGIARRKTDRSVATSWKALPDNVFPLHSDHFLCEAAFTIEIA